MSSQRLIFLLVMPLVMFSFSALAQDEEEGQNKDKKPLPEYHFTTGVLLPNQIDGVTEQSGFFGLKYAWPKGKRKNLFQEAGFNSINAWGVTYFNPFFSWRLDVELEGLIAHIYMGGDGHYYTYPVSDPNTGGTSNKTVYMLGGHVGGGFSAGITENLFFRADMKFNLNPGTALIVGFSIYVKMEPLFGGSKEGPGQNQ